jgi:hypothetical protein
MSKVFLAAAFAAVISAPAFAAESLDDIMPSVSGFSTEVHVACGSIKKANCDKVLPRIAEQSVPKGVRIIPVESKGTVHSANALCKVPDRVQAAIGQRDGFDEVRRQTECVGSIDLVGKPLYPYFGYMVTLASKDFDSLNEMVEKTPQGKFRSIAAGQIGSGGQTTLGYMLNNIPAYKQTILPQPYDQNTALDKLVEGGIDAYFVMDGPGSALIEDIAKRTDDKKKPIFKFVEINMPSDFYKSVKDWNGKPMYYKSKLESGGILGFGSKDTISTDAVLVVANKYNQGNPGTKATSIIRESADKAEAAIRADVNAPKDWNADR